MFVQPIAGSVITYQSKELLFHSTPEGLVQYENVETGEIHKWTNKEFFDDATDGRISNVRTINSTAQIEVASPPEKGHASLLVGLTDWEAGEQARNAHAFKAYERSGLHLKRDAETIQAIVDQACSEAGFPSVSLGQLKRIQRDYRRHRDLLYACTPFRRGPAVGEYNVNERDEALMTQAIEQHYLVLEQPSIASAHRHYLRLREDDQAKNGVIDALPVSLRTFERRVGRLESFYRTERRHGIDEAHRKHRVVRGVYADVDPMEVGEMDDCYIPVLVVSDDYTHALGVPKLSSKRDRATGYVPSFFLWCGEVSTFTALATFRNQLSDKAPLLRAAGLAEDAWPYAGPFRTVLIDRGPNLDAKATVRAATAMGSSVQMCPTKKPWKKPFVERLHAYVLDCIAKEIPGRLFDDLVSFRSYKAKVKAIVPLSALIRILVQFFVEVINGVPRPGHRLTPTEELVAFLKDHPPPIPCDPAKLQLMTSMEIERTVNQEGVRWESLHFVSDELAAMVKRTGPGVKVKVYVNPADLGKVTVIDPRTREEIPAYCTWHGYADGLSLPEHQLLCRMLRARRERIRLSALIRLQRTIAAELEAARQGKKLSAAALKAERNQQSSETLPTTDSSASPAPTGANSKKAVPVVPAENTQVLEALLF